MVRTLLFSILLAALVPIPEPPTENLQPAVREQLEAARAAVEILGEGEGPGEKGVDEAEKARRYARLGRLYLLYDFPGSAAPALARALELDPTAWRARYLSAVIDQDSGRFESALEHLATVLDLKPGDVPSLLRQGEIRLRLRRLPAALESFEQAAALRPISASAQYGLGRALSAQRDFERAAESFEQALRLQPRATAIYHPLARVRRYQGDLDAARDLLRRAGESRPVMDDPVMAAMVEESVLARTFLLQGDRAQRRGLHEDALRFYRRALELDSADPGIHYNIGALYASMGRLDEAEIHFRSTLELDPSRADAFFNLAVGLRSRGDLEAAAEAFARAAQLAPEDPEARLELAITLYSLGRREAAKREIASASEMLMSGEEATELTRRLWGYLKSMDDPEGADRMLRGAVERWPASSFFRLAWAERLADTGRDGEATGHFEAAWRQEAAKGRAADSRLATGAARGLAEGKAQQGIFDEALRVLREAIEVHGERPPLVLAQARLLASAPEPFRDAERARLLLDGLGEDVISGPAESLEHREILAMALAATGDYESAASLQTELLAELAAAGSFAELSPRWLANLQAYQAGKTATQPW